MCPNEMKPMEEDKMESANGAVNVGKATASQANIAYIFDDNYAAITGVSITSLFENNKDLNGITVYLLAKNLSEENVRKFKQLGEMYGREIVFVDISDADEQFRQMGLNAYNGNFITYAKMFCVDFVPKAVKQLIYLDSDTIIVDSIRPILAVKGLLGMTKGGVICRAQSAADYVAPYACAVLVFDAERWRNEKWSDKLLEHAKREGKKYLVPDENMLSIVVKDEIVKLPLEFCFPVHNCAFSKEDYIDLHPCEEYTPEEAERAYEHPIIIHADKFLGEKPWLKGNNHPNKELFSQWLARSLWKDYDGGVCSGGNVIKLERWMYRHLPRRWFYRIWNVAQWVYVKKATKKLMKA